MSTIQQSTFSTLLKRYRDDACLTQEELAERAGLSVEAISALERGVVQTPRKDTVFRLAGALDLPPMERETFIETARKSPRSSHPHAQGETAMFEAPVRVLPDGRKTPYPVPEKLHALTRPRRTVLLSAVLLFALLGAGTSVLTYNQVHGTGTSALPPRGSFSSWGWTRGAPLRFSNPRHLAVDRKGNLYVVDEWKRTISELSSSGELLRTWDSALFGRGMDTVPTGVTVDGQGTLYVSDITNFRVVSIAPDARVRTLWTLGEFNFDHLDVAVDGGGNIYAVDTSHRVSKLSSGSGVVAHWGSYGQSCRAGYFFSPYALTVDRQGSVYVTDWSNDCVQKMSSTGHTFTVLGSPGSGPGQFRQPSEITLDRYGNLYVADGGNDRIQELSPDGKFLAMWGTRGTRPGQFLNPQGVAVDGDGHIYESDAGSGRVQKLSSNGQAITEWRPWRRSPAQFDRPCCLTVNPGGVVYVLDSGAGTRIRRVSPDGQVLADWRPQGLPAGQAFGFAGIAAAPSGDLYVVDGANDRLYRFSPSGHLLAQWGGPAQMSRPSGVAVDAAGAVYVADAGNNAIRKFSPAGKPDPRWSVVNLGSSPYGVAVDARGSVYVTSADTHVVKKLAPSGQVLMEWISRGMHTGQQSYPTGVAVDEHGIVYLSDPRANRIQAFSSDGRPLAEWGSGRFTAPNGVAVDSSGSVYVADTGNNRIQKLVSTRAIRQSQPGGIAG